MNYRPKPLLIKAFRYDGDFKGKNVPNWAIEAFEKEILYFRQLRFEDPSCELYIDTSVGTFLVLVGDYLVQIDGEIYPCKPKLFEKLCQPFEE